MARRKLKSKTPRKTDNEGLHWGSFLSACAILRNRLPSKKAVVVRRKKIGKDLSGYCNEGDKYNRFNICIDNTLEENTQILILMHEWAHALAWDADGSDHGPYWGRCYARCWRALVEEFND